MLTFIVTATLLGLLAWAAFKVIWAAIVAAVEKIISITKNLVAKLKVFVRKGVYAVCVLITRLVSGETFQQTIGKRELIDTLPDELETLMKKQQEGGMIHMKDEVTGW